MRTCTANIASKPQATREALAKVANTSLRNAPRVYCTRITDGIASGRLTRADINAGARGQVTPAVMRVLQGR